MSNIYIDLTNPSNRIIVQSIIDSHKALILNDTKSPYDPNETLTAGVTADYANKLIVRSLITALAG